MLITVFTPTYNRAKLLPRLHKSLQVQTNKDFEWVIVDDGSTDNTKEVIDNIIIQQDNDFPIR
ncbi:glycosyltransferase [Prevotella disiens]|nr:glycosyltransferase [Prevotella disiens]